MYKKRSKKGGMVEVDVVFSISGRLRLRVTNEPKNPLDMLNNLKSKTKLIKGSYCSVNRTFVLEYTPDEINLNKLILNFCGFYSADLGIKEIKLNYKLSKKHTMGYSSLISLTAILIDLGMNFTGIGAVNTKYRSFVRWCAVGTTIGAIFEHGYKELNENGAFDPEVMSIMYLINSVNKAQNQEPGMVFYPAIIAWLLTFGRHILTRQNRSIIISTVIANGEIKVIEEENKYFFFNQFVGSCFDVYQNVSVKKSLAGK